MTAESNLVGLSQSLYFYPPDARPSCIVSLSTTLLGNPAYWPMNYISVWKNISSMCEWLADANSNLIQQKYQQNVQYKSIASCNVVQKWNTMGVNLSTDELPTYVSF